MKEPNTIKAYHFWIGKDEVLHLKNKLYCWHIPKELRVEGIKIKKGDMVLARAGEGCSPVIVADVYREEFEETGKHYKPVVAMIHSKDG